MRNVVIHRNVCATAAAGASYEAEGLKETQMLRVEIQFHCNSRDLKRDVRVIIDDSGTVHTVSTTSGRSRHSSLPLK